MIKQKSKSPFKIFQNSDGFTVLEILIAITILSMMMFGVINVSNNSFETKDRILSEDKEYLQVETALARIEWDFSQIYTPLYFSTIPKKKKPEAGETPVRNPYERNPNYKAPDKAGRPVPIYKSEDKSSFEFFTKSHRRKIQNSKESEFAWVRYALQRRENREDDIDERKGLFTLVRQYLPLNIYDPAGNDLDKAKKFTVLDYIKKMEITYWDPKTKKLQPTLRNVQNGKNLLRLINVEITWINKNGAEETVNKNYRTLWPFFDPTAEEPKNKRTKPAE